MHKVEHMKSSARKSKLFQTRSNVEIPSQSMTVPFQIEIGIPH